MRNYYYYFFKLLSEACLLDMYSLMLKGNVRFWDLLMISS